LHFTTGRVGWQLVAKCNHKHGGGEQGGAAQAGGGGAGNGAAGASDAGAAGLSGRGGNSSGGAEAGAGGGPTEIEPIRLDAPSFRVEAMSEVTRCVELDLGNVGALQVGELRTTRGTGIFELRISAVSQANANASLRDCIPFDDVTDAGVKSLMYTKRASDGMVFPSGVGYSLESHQALRFEIHALNLSDTAIDTAVSATFVPMAPGAYQAEAGLLILQNLNITLGPTATGVTSKAYFPAPAGLTSANLFALAGDTHKMATALTLATAPTSAGARTVVYSPTWLWDQPELVTFTSPVKVPVGGGIELACQWNNNTQNTIHPGTSASDESCRGLIYHYPAVAARTCIMSGNATVCI
jgi:hypothetical protein